MTLIKSFIPPSLASAPKYPSQRPPRNLSLRGVVIDRVSSFEVWSPNSQGLLSEEEATFLRGDRFRVEAICSRLVRLLGATCSQSEEVWNCNSKHFYDWENVLDFASSSGFHIDTIDVIFCSQTLRPAINSSSESAGSWIFEPANWEIFFFQLEPTAGGFQIISRDNPLRIILWTGQPIVRAA